MCAFIGPLNSDQMDRIGETLIVRTQHITMDGSWWPLEVADEVRLAMIGGQAIWTSVSRIWATKPNNLHLGSNLPTRARNIAKEPRRVVDYRLELQRAS